MRIDIEDKQIKIVPETPQDYAYLEAFAYPEAVVSYDHNRKSGIIVRTKR